MEARMWELLKLELELEYLEAKNEYEEFKDEGMAGTYTAYLMALAIMKTIDCMEYEDVKKHIKMNRDKLEKLKGGK